MASTHGAVLLAGTGAQPSGIEVEIGTSRGKSNSDAGAAEEESMATKLGFLAVWKRKRRMEAEFMAAARAKRRQQERIRPEGGDDASASLSLAPSTPSRKLHRLARDADLDATQDFVNLLPESLALKIFSKVPPRAIASKCSLICKSWARLASAEGLWKDFCTPSGLAESDTAKVLGGWRGLFAAAFASNLVQSPHFERYQENELASKAEEEPSAFQARAKVLVERLVDADAVEMEYRGRSHWTDDVEELENQPAIDRVNGAFRTRVTAESLSQQPLPPTATGETDSQVGLSFCSGLMRDQPILRAQPTARGEGTDNGAAIDADSAPAASPAAAQPSSAEGSARGGQSWAAAAGVGTERTPPPAAALLRPSPSAAAAGEGGGGVGGARTVAAAVGLTAGADAGAGAGSVTSSLSLLHQGRRARPEAGTEAIRTAPSSWGRLLQSISLAAFPARFLDTCPPLRVSAWCARNVADAAAEGARFRIQLLLHSEDGCVLHHWDSGDMDWSSPGWHCFSALVHGYPQGVRSMVVRVAGKGVDYTNLQAHFSPHA